MATLEQATLEKMRILAIQNSETPIINFKRFLEAAGVEFNKEQFDALIADLAADLKNKLGLNQKSPT